MTVQQLINILQTYDANKQIVISVADTTKEIGVSADILFATETNGLIELVGVNDMNIVSQLTGEDNE